MKHKRLLKNKLFIGGAIVLVAAVMITAVLLAMRDAPPETELTTETSNVTVQPPSVSSSESADSTPSEERNIPDDKIVDSDVAVELEQITTIASSVDDSSSVKAEQPAQPVSPVEPEQPRDAGGIQIGGGEQREEYHCGSPNHHCEGPETHAYLLNLELEGCPYCGSHSCASFYATDAWGGAIVDTAKCPKYDAMKDPAKYCQKCGREMWSKSNPTGCFSYLLDTQCECGEYVKGNTCHHH